MDNTTLSFPAQAIRAQADRFDAAVRAQKTVGLVQREQDTIDDARKLYATLGRILSVMPTDAQSQVVVRIADALLMANATAIINRLS